MTIERATPAERLRERGGAGAATAQRIRQVLRSRPRLAAAVVTGALLLGVLPASWRSHPVKAALRGVAGLVENSAYGQSYAQCLQPA